MEVAQSGDTLIIGAGRYLEAPIPVDKRLVIIGEEGAVIDGESEHEIFVVSADSVHISGLELRNVGVSYIKELSAISLTGADHCVIENNKLINSFFGIYLAKSNYSVIRNNEIIGEAVDEASSGNAIHLWYSKNSLIENNVVKNHRDGIYLEFVDNSTINENHSSGNLRYGLHFMFSNDDDYHNNYFEDNGAGVAVMYSRNIIMTGNKFYQNWGPSSYGLLLKEIYDGEISNNIFDQNTIGIFAESSNRIMFENNTFRSNGIALKIYGSCIGLTVNSATS